MLTIRLQRTGRKNLATYRVVVAEHARPVKGKFIEILGFYLPQQKESQLKVDSAKVQAWIAKGARPSDTLARLLKKSGMPNMEKFMLRYTKQRRKGEEPAPAETPAPAAAPAAEVKAEPAPAEEAAAGDSATPSA